MVSTKPSLCWITPDYFLQVDTPVVPRLAKDYDIDWVVINTHNSKRTSDGFVFDTLKPREVNLRYNQRDPRIILQYVKLLREIVAARRGLLYTSFHGLPYFLPIMALLVNVDDVIYGVHNVTTPKGASNERLMRIYHYYVFKQLKHFHVFSKYQLLSIAELLPDKKHYYAPLIVNDHNGAKPGPGQDVIRFLFFGYIRKYKRLDLLIRAFQQLYSLGVPNIELCIAGSCDDWERYQSMITIKEGIKTRIEVIPDSEIPELIAACHYVVMPYQDGAQSGVLNLAWEYHKPVIASDIDAFRQFIVDGSTGFLFESQSVESLTAVMRETVRKHSAIYETLQQNIKEYVAREHSIDQVISMYKDFLDECLAGKGTINRRYGAAWGKATQKCGRVAPQ